MEAALRETFEETGVVILPRYLNEGEIQVTNVVVDAQPWLTVFYIAVIDFIPEAVVKEPDKCGGWRLSRDRYLDKDFPLFKPFEEYVVRYGWPQLNEG